MSKTEWKGVDLVGNGQVWIMVNISSAFPPKWERLFPEEFESNVAIIFSEVASDPEHC